MRTETPLSPRPSPRGLGGSPEVAGSPGGRGSDARPGGGPRRRITEEHVAKVFEMRAAGKLWREIGKALGFGFRSLRVRYRAAGGETRVYTSWRVGDVVGSFRLVRRNHGGVWVGRCRCGRESALHPSQAAKRPTGVCTDCYHRSVWKPALCESCGTEDEKRFGGRNKHRCVACDRRFHRNGGCACGAALVGGGKRCPRGCAVSA